MDYLLIFSGCAEMHTKGEKKLKIVQKTGCSGSRL